MEKLIEIKDNEFIKSLFGVGDKNVKQLEEKFKVQIILRSEGISVKGEEKQVEKVGSLLDKMYELFKRGIIFTPKELELNFSSAIDLDDYLQSFRIKVPSPKKKFVFPKTEGQKKYLLAMKDYDITFAVGPAGTGKTYLAMAYAVNYLTNQKVSRIILTRPAIEAGESLGFLPGDMYQKLGPYLRPLYDALYDMMEPDTIEEYLETGVIEIAPLAYMRGRTLNNAFIILDEAQNCTSEQLKMFLTRLGFDSKTVITGDITQSDLPGGKPIGLMEAVKILKPIKGIKFVYLTKKDVVRHPLIQKIIQAYEDFYEKG
ncbi:MAG: PhoH family protein [Candidatus Omnitrophica bacterium]|nr:PhoH family protein [Candidatus Omnitrophota bacterium]